MCSLSVCMLLAFKLHCAGEFDGPPAYVAPGGDVQPSPSTTHTNNPVQAADALAIQSTGGHCSLQPLHSACKSLRREAGDSQVITTKPIGEKTFYVMVFVLWKFPFFKNRQMSLHSQLANCIQLQSQYNFLRFP